jgi:hypothetical protein
MANEKIIVKRGDQTHSSDRLGLFGIAELERGEDDYDIHCWPLDADHVLDEELTCECRPRVEMQWVQGTRLVVHRKTN